MFDRLRARRKSGSESFTQGDVALGFTVLDFWQWSSSDLVSNVLRGRVAEFLVARALGVDQGVRNEWDAYDLLTNTGLRVEVKSAAYLQSWAQRCTSSISFDIRETVAWDADSNTFAPESERRRQADLYVFALLAHEKKETLNPLDVSQWEFFVLPTSTLNRSVGKPRRISLKRLVELNGLSCSYSSLRGRVDEVASVAAF